jgi:hypothetical protein
MKLFRGKGSTTSQDLAKMVVIFLCLFSFALKAQPISVKNLQSDPYRKPLYSNFVKTDPNLSISYKVRDTLTLPFFEDFAYQSFGFPDQNRWCDVQVWVNPSFGVNPPNYQVATFDHLNPYGKPYSTLDKQKMVFADSLTSQPINLQYYFKGPTSYQYQVTDNLFLSFYYQPQGFGDRPEVEDSLILFFKNSRKEWVRIWSVGGTKLDTFSQVYIPINNTDYLFKDFQFRWVNYTKSTGNLNHWNIDYIRLDKGRNPANDNIEDVGIVNVYNGLIKDYYNVPYSHYKLSSSIKGIGPRVTVGNLYNKTAIQTRFQLDIKNRFGKEIFLQPFASSSRNILKKSDTVEKFDVPFFDTLSTPTPSLKFTYQIAPQSNDNLPSNYNATTDNNKVELTHHFLPWYAYDDGSAEGAFGLDYAYLGNIKGQFAMEFNTIKDDSLRGIAMYFTQTNVDVSQRSFKIRIWKALSPIGSADNKDQLVYEMNVEKPIYRDSVNLFHYFFFDSTIHLAAGTYYVGWLQNMPYVLNVGYDNNYRYNYKEQRNPHLFYNLLGSWENVDYEIMGTPMIRMLFGERIDYAFSTKKIEKISIKAFPNPTNHLIQLMPSAGIVSKTEICDVSGRIVMTSFGDNHLFDVSKLKSGIYLARITTISGQIGTTQFIKQ